MKRSTQLLLGTAAVFSGCALVTWMFALSRLNFDFTAMKLNIGLLTVYALAIYYVNYSLCAKGLSLGLYTALQLLFAGLAAFLFPRFCALEPAVTRPVVIGAVLYACLIIATAYAAAGELRSHIITLCFDGAGVMLLSALLFNGWLKLPLLPGVVLMSVSAMALCIFALMAARIDREDSADTLRGDPAAGRLVLAVALLLVLGAAGLAVALAGEGMHSLSQTLLAALKAIIAAGKALLRFVGGIVEAILHWLSRFVDSGDVASTAMIAGGSGSVDTTGQNGTLTLPSYVGYIAASLVLVGIVVLLLRMRGERVKAPNTLHRRASRRRVHRESGLSAAFRALWQGVGQKMKYYVNCARCRRSAPGLLIWCERRVPPALRRKTGESGSAFLRRLAAESGEEQQLALWELAGILERHFYAGGQAGVSRDLYRRIRQCEFHEQ